MGILRKFLVIWSLIFMITAFCQNNIQKEFISTFLGGSEKDDGYEPIIIEGPDGFIYVSGYTSSPDFPVTSGSFDESHNGGQDRFICKFDKDLKTLVASTFLGGYGDEAGMGLCFDNEGNLIIAGYTYSTNFPTTDNAYDKYINGKQDVFITKMDKDLTTVLASTYYGGSLNEGPFFPRIDVTINNEGDIYIAGITYSTNLATTGSYDKSHNGNIDFIVAKFDSELSTLKAATYLGSSGNEWRPNLLIDDAGNVFLGGDAGASNYPTTNGAYQTTYKDGGYDIMISKLSSDLSTLLASTWIGATGEEDMLSMKLDNESNIIFTGYTTSPNYPTSTDAFDRIFSGGWDIVLTKMDNDLTKILSSTYIGGANIESGQDIALDKDGNVILVGQTASSNFPTVGDCYDKSYNGGYDAYVIKLDKNFENVLASTYIGGNSNERAQSVVLDLDYNIFITGRTTSSDYPTTSGIFDESYNGGDNDCFITKLNSELSLTSLNNEFTTEIPKEFYLHNNYPNPFNPSTTIKFELDVESDVKIRIFNLSGEVVKTLVNENLPAGVYTTCWKGKNENGNEVASGIYFCELKNNKGNKVIKMNLIK